MLDLSAAGLGINVTAFLTATGVIVWSGIRLAALGDKLADRLGWGEAITGTMFLGFTTALPGLAASVTAAIDGRPALAISNAIGGIAVQTTFLAFADIAYRKANLEHAAASVPNMIQTAMLIVLLAIVALGLAGPDIAVAHVHPVTVILFIAAVAGFWLVYRSKNEPMWRPRVTAETVEDVPEDAHSLEHLPRLLVNFLVCAAIITGAGAAIAHTTGYIADESGINESLAGALLSGIATSLPELVTTVAAVRRGALTLAVSDIVGGNLFDVMFVFAADLVFLSGSLYHAPGVGRRELFLCGLAISLNAIFLLGLLFRQRAGPANIGFESVLMLLVYASGLGGLYLIE